MFRGKESLNIIKLSRLVQELLNFGVLSSLQLWGWGVGVWRWGVVWGVPLTHVHMHTYACICTHSHACVLNMIISCKWPPPLGESLGIPYDVIHTCTCVCMHACMCVCMSVGCTLSPPPPPPSTHPPPPGGDPRNPVKIQ